MLFRSVSTSTMTPSSEYFSMDNALVAVHGARFRTFGTVRSDKRRLPREVRARPTHLQPVDWLNISTRRTPLSLLRTLRWNLSIEPARHWMMRTTAPPPICILLGDSLDRPAGFLQPAPVGQVEDALWPADAVAALRAYRRASSAPGHHYQACLAAGRARRTWKDALLMSEAAVTPAGKRPVSAFGNGSLNVWDLETRRFKYRCKADMRRLY